MGCHSDILQPSPAKGTPPFVSHVQAFDAQGLTHACVQDGEERPHAFSAADLRALHTASAESPERAATHRWRWMLNSGKLPSLDHTMSEVDVQYMANNPCISIEKDRISSADCRALQHGSPSHCVLDSETWTV